MMIVMYCLSIRGGDEPDEFEVFQNEDDISNSVPAPKFSFRCNPGANKIDVIRYFNVRKE